MYGFAEHRKEKSGRKDSLTAVLAGQVFPTIRAKENIDMNLHGPRTTA
jgi:hypothetical protein